MKFSLKSFRKPIDPGVKHFALGGIMGLLILHPLTMIIYWFEFNKIQALDSSLGVFILHRIVKSFSGEMLPMAVLFILIGGIMGSIFGFFYKTLARRNRLIQHLTEVIGKDLENVIGKGEGETIEFKSSLRWNYQTKKVDKILELTVLKTIAGFMNNRLGTLLIGVDDSGGIVGLSQDYNTLKRKNPDGFEQHLMALISSKLGADLCPLIHVLFHQFGGMDVCRIICEAAPRPVYVQDGDKERFFLRTGNSTKTLKVHEAIEHVGQHWPKT